MQAEAYFLKSLKINDKDSFFKAIEIFEKINKSDVEIRRKISYLKSEIGGLFHEGKNYEEAEKYLNDCINISKEIGDNFLLERYTIDLVLILQKKNKNINEFIKLLNIIINNEKNLY